LLEVLTSNIFLLIKYLDILALYAKQFLEIKLFTFDYHENKSQRMVYTVNFTGTNVLLDQMFILRRSSPLMYHGNYIISSKIINAKHKMLWNKEKRRKPDIRKIHNAGCLLQHYYWLI